MKLQLSLKDSLAFAQPIKTTHEGFSGGEEIKCILVRSVSDEHYYTNLRIKIDVVAGEELVESQLLTNNAWSLKLISSDAEPTDDEWGDVLPNQSISLNDIGSAEGANKDYVQQVWVRIFCPGHTDPNIVNSKISLSYNTLLVTNEAI